MVYGITWKYGILQDLYELCFQGRLLCFISDLLSDCLIHVKIGFALSEFHVQEDRVPH